MKGMQSLTGTNFASPERRVRLKMLSEGVNRFRRH